MVPTFVRSAFHNGDATGGNCKSKIVDPNVEQRFVGKHSAISPRGELRFMVVNGGVGAEVFIRFLKRLIEGAKRPIFPIVDGHPSHRARAVKAYVESLGGHLKLFFLPAYSPELNPDEQVWNDVKNNAVGRT